MNSNLDNDQLFNICASLFKGFIEWIDVNSQNEKALILDSAYQFKNQILNQENPTLQKKYFETGPQYRSAVFFQNEAQRETAQLLKDLLIQKGYDVATEILPAAEFYSAENYHQDYYDNKGGTPYCHAPRKLF